MGESIGALIGNVEAAEFYEYPGKKVIIKIKVAINIHNPITSGIHVGNPIDGTCWIDYRYKKLPQVCFNCGRIGHYDKLCRNQPLNLETLAPLGPWIRSTQYGKRKMEAKDKKFYSNPSLSKEFGHYSPPVPSDLLEKLAAMKVSTSNLHNDNQQQQPHSNAESPMKQQHASTGEKGEKVYRQTISNEATNMDLTPAVPAKELSYQAKRQKLEELSRAGTARQASPQL
jgi:hypothetical protein